MVEQTPFGRSSKLGRAAGSEPVVFVDWKPRLLGMGRADTRLYPALNWDFVKRTKSALRAGTLKENGAAVRRLKAALAP